MPKPDYNNLENTLRYSIKQQYHGALAMLKQAIEVCPDDLWDDAKYMNRFWRMCYHTLHSAHLYLQQEISTFTPWTKHMTFAQDMDDYPAPPEWQELVELPNRPPITGPYSKADILEYWAIVDGLIDDGVDKLDLLSPESGFPWHMGTGKLEHQMMSIRHIQHHIGHLTERLRVKENFGLDWVRPKPQQ